MYAFVTYLHIGYIGRHRNKFLDVVFDLVLSNNISYINIIWIRLHIYIPQYKRKENICLMWVLTFSTEANGDILTPMIESCVSDGSNLLAM